MRSDVVFLLREATGYFEILLQPIRAEAQMFIYQSHDIYPGYGTAYRDITRLYGNSERIN